MKRKRIAPIVVEPLDKSLSSTLVIDHASNNDVGDDNNSNNDIGDDNKIRGRKLLSEDCSVAIIKDNDEHAAILNVWNKNNPALTIDHQLTLFSLKINDENDELVNDDDSDDDHHKYKDIWVFADDLKELCLKGLNNKRKIQIRNMKNTIIKYVQRRNALYDVDYFVLSKQTILGKLYINLFSIGILTINNMVIFINQL
jgi:hypothetical protein